MTKDNLEFITNHLEPEDPIALKKKTNTFLFYDDKIEAVIEQAVQMGASIAASQADTQLLIVGEDHFISNNILDPKIFIPLQPKHFFCEAVYVGEETTFEEFSKIPDSELGGEAYEVCLGSLWRQSYCQFPIFRFRYFLYLLS